MNFEIAQGIQDTAASLGIDPVDLATAISYETAGSFDPTKTGPTTRWGTHKGLIQWGEPQAKEYGVDWNDPVGSQLGKGKAVEKYLKKAGVKPGMGLLDIYSAINAGEVGRYNASDTAAGGAPGTVRDKVERQMEAHRVKAQALMNDNIMSDEELFAALGLESEAPQAQQVNNFDMSDEELFTELGLGDQPTQLAAQPRQPQHGQDLRPQGFLDRLGREPFIQGVVDPMVGGAQAIANVMGGDTKEAVNKWVTEREKKIDYALKNDPMEKSYIYDLTGISPERVAGNVMGMPFGLAVKGASLLAKAGAAAGNFAFNLFTTPTAVEEDQTYLGEKGKEALTQAAFMGALSTRQGFREIKNFLKADVGVDQALQNIDLPDELKNSDAVRKTLRVLSQNKTALERAGNAEEMADIMKKSGIDAQLNDVLGGAIEAQAASARTNMATLDPARVREMDARRAQQLGGAIDRLKYEFSEGNIVPSPSETGLAVRNEMQDFLKREQQKASQAATQFYDKAKYGVNAKSKAFEGLYNSDTAMGDKVRPYIDAAFDTVKASRGQNSNLPTPELGSYEVMLEARKLLDQDINYNKVKMLGSSSADERILKNARAYIDSFIKSNANMAKGDEIYQDAFGKMTEQKINKIVQIAKKGDENLATVGNQLFANTTDIRQFRKISERLSKDTRRNLLNNYLEDITTKYKTDTAMKRLFDDTQSAKKFMMLLHGDPQANKKMRALKNINKITKAMASSRMVMENSTTANKLTAMGAGQISTMAQKLVRGVVNGSGRGILDATIGAASESFPVVQQMGLNMTKKMEDDFFNFILNPDNTKKFAKVLDNINELGNISTKQQYNNFIKNTGINKIPGLKDFAIKPKKRNLLMRQIGLETGRSLDNDEKNNF